MLIFSPRLMGRIGSLSVGKLWLMRVSNLAASKQVGYLLGYVCFPHSLHLLQPETSQKDCIVLSMVPPDPSKSPFRELRQVIPVRLTTDLWSLNNDDHPNFDGSEYSVPSTPDDHLEAQPELRYWSQHCARTLISIGGFFWEFILGVHWTISLHMCTLPYYIDNWYTYLSLTAFEKVWALINQVVSTSMMSSFAPLQNTI